MNLPLKNQKPPPFPSIGSSPIHQNTALKKKKTQMKTNSAAAIKLTAFATPQTQKLSLVSAKSVEKKRMIRSFTTRLERIQIEGR